MRNQGYSSVVGTSHTQSPLLEYVTEEKKSIECGKEVIDEVPTSTF